MHIWWMGFISQQLTVTILTIVANMAFIQCFLCVLFCFIWQVKIVIKLKKPLIKDFIKLIEYHHYLLLSVFVYIVNNVIWKL